eukprot:TRINITY_DN6867_c0_g2_i1.p1 TRINITY_DN6867_c0_g2~~TRINITY_DN6867_c0_g2_i1.p1  ORF type:complete len:101 (+),score=16.70 TRINITY_DN6867_c0_g2_i1:115-417(+)
MLYISEIAPSTPQYLPNHMSVCTVNGQIVRAYETQFPSSSIDDGSFSWTSANQQIVYVLTANGDLYRSPNEGRDWELESINSKMRTVEDSVNVKMKFTCK